jgi:integrase
LTELGNLIRRHVPQRLTLAVTGLEGLVAYSFRHTKITALIERGQSPAVIADALGTSPQMIEAHYKHLLGNHAVMQAVMLAGL